MSKYPSIKIQNIKSIRRPHTFDLKKLNLFVGANNSGKSAMGKWFEILRKNGIKKGHNEYEIHNICNFEKKGEDWRNWTHKGDFYIPTVYSTTVDVFGVEGRVEVTFEMDPHLRSFNQEELKCASITAINIYFGTYRVVRWDKEKREFYPGNLVGTFANHFYPKDAQKTVEDLDKEAEISDLAESFDMLRHFKKMNSEDLWNLVDELPKVISVADKTSSFHLALKEIAKEFWKLQFLTEEYALLKHSLVLVMTRVCQGLGNSLSNSLVLKGDAAPEWRYYFDIDMNDSLKKFFGLEIQERKLSNEDGEFFDYQYFVMDQGVRAPIEDCGSGVRKVLSWLTEWYNAVGHMEVTNDEMDDQPFVIIIQEPERELHPNWQWAWAEWLMHELSKKCYTNFSVVVETHSPIIIKAIQCQQSESKFPISDIALFDFKKEAYGETIVQNVTLKETEDWSSYLSKGLMDKVVIKGNEDEMRRPKGN